MHLPHELKFSVRWNKANTVFRLELAEFNTLMELAVVDRYSSLSSSVQQTSQVNTKHNRPKKSLSFRFLANILFLQDTLAKLNDGHPSISEITVEDKKAVCLTQICKFEYATLVVTVKYGPYSDFNTR